MWKLRLQVRWNDGWGFVDERRTKSRVVGQIGHPRLQRLYIDQLLGGVVLAAWSVKRSQTPDLPGSNRFSLVLVLRPLCSYCSFVYKGSSRQVTLPISRPSLRKGGRVDMWGRAPPTTTSRGCDATETRANPVPKAVWPICLEAGGPCRWTTGGRWG